MKISLIEPLNVSEEIINQLAQPIIELGHQFEYYSEVASDSEEIFQRCKDSEIVMVANHPLPTEVIERLDTTQFINIAFTGVDHVDVELATKKGIKVANASGYSNRSVPELAIGLTLAVYRNIAESELIIKSNKSDNISFQGKEINNKVVGIVGTGELGVETAKLFKAFGAQLLGYNRSEKEEAKVLDMEYTSLEDIMRRSDIISIHLPLTSETKGIISDEMLSLMKSDAIIINVARGAIIDNNALAQRLNEGEILGAGIDVFDYEPPLAKDYPLLNAKNAVLTPHVGYLTDESMEKRAKIVFDNTINYINGHPSNLVN